MKCLIEITMDNAAFSDDPATETARILRELADRIERCGVLEMPLRDVNGNTVGRVTVEDEE